MTAQIIRVGIDGSNLRQGGGITHLAQLLTAADPVPPGISHVTVWGARALLDQLPDRPWLARVHRPELERGGGARLWFQQVGLAHEAGRAADLLFSPGGTYLGRFRPFVAMFRNMLPFDPGTRRAYGYSGMRLKLEALRRAQSVTFRRADGVIFLTEHARATVTSQVLVRGRQAVIPHGVDARFFDAGRRSPAETPSAPQPFRWLYVSVIHRYKHPWNVIEAVAAVRDAGLPATLHLVGPPHPSALATLQAALDRHDPGRTFVSVTPGVPHADLPNVYRDADAFVFASTCENLPNALLEAMAAGLPVVCSDRSPMPEVLGDGGVYCDPESPRAIAAAMRRLMEDRDLQTKLAGAAAARARAYSWSRCAFETFEFLATTARGPFGMGNGKWQMANGMGNRQ